MTDALTLKSDEGRGLAAICFGEVPGNLWSEDLRMGKPRRAKRGDLACMCERQTQGSETSQYLEEKKSIDIPLVAASETGGAQTGPHHTECDGKILNSKN